jgi:hypothetical protein
MSPEFDGYITKAPPFAQPILNRLRALFHRACPEITEALKWGHPAFEHHGIVGGMAAFKKHVRLGFWKGRLLRDPKRLFCGPRWQAGGRSDRDRRGRSFRQTRRCSTSSARRWSSMPRAPRSRARPRQPKPCRSRYPQTWRRRCARTSERKAGFDALSTTHRNEYVEWLVTAKQEATRGKRLLTTIEWLCEGKPRHWKYMKAR